MLNKLTELTSSAVYHSQGNITLLNVTINPGEVVEAKLTLNIVEKGWEDEVGQIWEVQCSELAYSYGIPTFLVPPSQIKVLHNHPLLWVFEDEVFFSITSTTNEIASVMGDLFIEHSGICGNWISFQSLYSSFPETLQTLRRNQLSIPIPLKNACFDVLDKYGIKYIVNEIQQNEKGYSVLFFSYTKAWPDEENFNQPYIIAKQFSEQRIS